MKSVVIKIRQSIYFALLLSFGTGFFYPKSVIRLLCANKLSFCHLPFRFSVAMEPHCALKTQRHLNKNKSCYHHNANDRFGFNDRLYMSQSYSLLIKQKSKIICQVECDDSNTRCSCVQNSFYHARMIFFSSPVD